MISRGVTCDADNLLTSVLQRKHPHELLDSVVKERLVKSFSSQPRRAFYSVLCICQAVILRSFQSFLCNFNHLRFVRLGVSRQREANSTALQSAVNSLFHRCRFKHLNRSTSSLLTSSNSLILKEFSVSSAPEVGRIIETFRGASSTYLNFCYSGCFSSRPTRDSPSNCRDSKYQQESANAGIYSPLF